MLHTLAVVLGMPDNSGKTMRLVFTCPPLLQSDFSPISSCLVESRRGMKQALLGMIGTGLISSRQDIQVYLDGRWGRLLLLLRLWHCTNVA